MESPMPVIWLQRCAALAAWLWVVPGAGAPPTFMPIDVPTPRVGAVGGASVAGIGVVNHDGAGGIAVTTVDPNGDPVPGATGQGRLPIGSPATGTVTDPPPIDSQSPLLSPFTLRGQAAIAGASDAIPNGDLVYVCGSSGISVFDVTNVTAPQFLRTVGTPAGTCQIRGDRLVALRGGNTLVLALYTLTDPRIPQRLGSTPEIPYNFAGDLAITDTHAFVTTLTFDFFLSNRDIFRHTGDVLSIDLSVPSAPRLDGVLLNTNGTNNDGIGVVGGVDPSGGNFNMFSVAQADAQTLLVSSTTVTGGDTQTGTGLVRVLDIGAPGNLSELRVLQIPGAVHLIGVAIQGNRALAVASSGGWQDFFTDQNAGLSGNVVLATLEVSAPRNPQLIAMQTLSRASRGVDPPVSFGNNQYAFSSLGASGDTPQLFLVDATDPTRLILGQMDIPSEISRMRAQGDLLYTASPSGLLIYEVNFEAELASTQLTCKNSGCRVSVTCNLAPALGTSCTNQINLFVRVPRRLAEDVAAKAPRRIKFATAIANVPPGGTESVRLRLTSRGRKIVRTSDKKKLGGVMEIRNSAGTAIDRTTVRVRIR